MASCYETASENFTVQPIRAPDAAFLRGLTEAPGPLPEPIALAQPPAYYTGPSGAVGGGEKWMLSMQCPGAEVAWVVVSADWCCIKKTGVNPPAAMFWEARSGVMGQMGPGANLTEVTNTASAGTYVDMVFPTTPTNHGMWKPIDPQYTTSTFATRFAITAGAGGLAIDDLQLFLMGIYFVGFPISVWGTGLLWRPTASRGS